ncbi:MAG: hypothetical protein Q8P05_01605 [Candidatus Diapherotrites archaeon]|nr:hypothetical protein [Candidatus Diapherotrites archaeon]MDZ4256236.1 hypothetical protein [archaeon]
MHVGYRHHSLFRRHWNFYVALQVLIFIKVILFYIFLGHGVSYAGQPMWLDLPFIGIPVFGNPIHVFDYIFHQLMHALIFVWVFLLAKHIRKIEWKNLALLFLVAVVLHNIGYWLTASHPSLAFSVRDFLVDYASLWVFFGLARFGLKVLPQVGRFNVPVLEPAR